MRPFARPSLHLFWQVYYNSAIAYSDKNNNNNKMMINVICQIKNEMWKNVLPVMGAEKSIKFKPRRSL